MQSIQSGMANANNIMVHPKVLVYLEEGPMADVAFTAALEQAQRLSGHLILFGVIEPNLLAPFSSYYFRKQIDNGDYKCRRMLARYAYQCEAGRVSYELLIGTSQHPASLICDVIRDNLVDYVVLAEPRTNWLQRRVLDSVGHYVLQYAYCSIIFARQSQQLGLASSTGVVDNQQPSLYPPQPPHYSDVYPIEMTPEMVAKLHYVKGILSSPRPLSYFKSPPLAQAVPVGVARTNPARVSPATTTAAAVPIASQVPGQSSVFSPSAPPPPASTSFAVPLTQNAVFDRELPSGYVTRYSREFTSPPVVTTNNPMSYEV